MTTNDPSASSVPGSPLPWSLGRRIVAVGGWLCLVAAIGACAVLRTGDVWEPATIAMFGPLRLLAILPAALLIVAVLVNRRALITLVPALLLTIIPVSGYCVPWEQLGSNPPGPRLRVLTCNMHYAKVPVGPLDRLIDETGPDVVALQEWRDGLDSNALATSEWHTHRESGRFLASRYPIRRTETIGDHSFGDRGSVSLYELNTPTGVVTVFSVHFASPREGLVEVKGGKGQDGIATNSELRWAQSRYLAGVAAQTVGPLVLVGDFNTPPQSAIFREVWDPYEDAFSAAGWGWGYTFSARLSAVRIDHILAGRGGRATRCWVGPNVGSPHRPVLADLVWPTDAAR